MTISNSPTFCLFELSNIAGFQLQVCEITLPNRQMHQCYFIVNETRVRFFSVNELF